MKTNLTLLAVGFVIGVIIAKSTSTTRAYAATSNTRQIYHGGPVIANPKLRIIFWGDFTRASPTMAQVDAQVRKLFASTYFNTLAEYGVRKPQYVGAVNFKSTPPMGWDLPEVRKAFSTLYTATDRNTLYYFIAQPDVRARELFGGFHSPRPALGGTIGGHGYGYNMDYITEAIGEEVAEFATDPSDSGWHAATGSKKDYEVVDVCAGNKARVNGVSVNGIWSNKQGRCVFS